ncbi:COMM domain-containing protein 9-like [Antedon mediterranea]|uniref:COMM domain-containing protein 9-like n=1 Tax=Antedon mediterranea TaxID=105859 RepID=UPI003AF54BAB
MADTDFEVLNLLLKANAKELVIELCQNSFTYRNASSYPEKVILNTSNTLEVDKADSLQLLQSLATLIQYALYIGCTSVTSVKEIFPGDFHKSLKDLLSKIIAEYLPTWRKSSINNQVSLPRLVDFDWRVDVKTCSDSISRMSVPTCLLNLQTRENAKDDKEFSCDSSVDLELNKQTLDTMLDALGKIRDQLDSVVTKK